MLKISFINADHLSEAIDMVAADLDISVVTEGADCIVEVSETKTYALNVEIAGIRLRIEYGGGVAVFLRGLAMALSQIRAGVTEKLITETPIFTLNGAMIDMSRNAVMNPDTVKLMMRKMALMGLNAFMLYTEDTYEIDGYPYFGYMRGRYTKEELKELDLYALKLGIELIPCIQTLGHLATHLKWSASTAYKDSAGNLFPGIDATYDLIDSMLNTVSECFTTKRVHIGLDETHELGRGRTLSLNGYRPPSELYAEHLNRVVEMVKARGLRPMMWSDMMMLFAAVGDTNGKHGYDLRNEHTDKMRDRIPEGLEQVFWDYYNPDERFYQKNIENHRRYLGNCEMFAGGVWAWSGYSVLLKRSLNFTIPALNACKQEGVGEVIATVWHNGSECNLITAVAGLAWYADYGYKGYYDEESMKECFKFATGESYDSFACLEAVDEPGGKLVPLSRAILYNDPLIPFADKTLEGIDFRPHYRELTERLSTLNVSSVYRPAFDTVTALSSLFENKADFGMRLKEAYDNKDPRTLESLSKECDLIVEKIKALRAAHKKAWMTYNKPFGWEIFDIRYGGLISRFETCKDRLVDYLSGTVQRLEELEAERLRIDGTNNPDTILGDHMLWRSYQSYVTAGIL